MYRTEAETVLTSSRTVNYKKNIPHDFSFNFYKTHSPQINRFIVLEFLRNIVEHYGQKIKYLH